nr:PREDICTED: uncharacterized protein LOC106706417 [Latimeria chalumnae]XP_014352843.1 PREDICTED: uncharacterized protein LOC106706417 [Latimeria chalumnae]XP_014352844.1 PREDICTED: uncharacterized protein LOC106706417 [Latimeria chalumnae]|eukprot:XP_014352842.1 PREDICTED: uncharacterized protein LOC106706417 [Latimeria chalumnae]
MSWQEFSLCTATIGPKSWIDAAVEATKLAQTLVEKSSKRGHAAVSQNKVRGSRGQLATPSRSREADSGIKVGERVSPIKTGECKQELISRRKPLSTEVENLGSIKEPDPQIQKSGGLKEDSEVLPFWNKACPPPFLREACADQSNELILKYMRQTRAVVSLLQKQLSDTNEEVKRIIRWKEQLESTLANIGKDLLLNRNSMNVRELRPSGERERDGADCLMDMERNQLLNLKLSLEAHLKDIQQHLQITAACRKRLNDCIEERGRALDLSAHCYQILTREQSNESRHGKVTPLQCRLSSQREEKIETFKPSPVGPYNTECHEAIGAAKKACYESRNLCKQIKEAHENAVALQQAAMKSVSDGLKQKVAETMALVQHLELSAGCTRSTIHRNQRWCDEVETSYGRALVKHYYF